MLVLSRWIDQKIIIGDKKIIITILDVTGNGKVSLGISADKDVIIHREEVYQEIQREKVKKYNS